MSDWRAGVGEIDITPPLGVEMTGYAGRPGPADHVLSRLHVRALALSDGGPPLVLTSGELLGIGRDTVQRIRELVAGVVQPERLLLNHTHTHAGPTTAPLRCMGEPDAAYVDLVARWTATAVQEAVRAMVPAQVAFGTAETTIGMNRREARDGRVVLGSNPGGTYDPSVHVLRVEDEHGGPLACWFSHATHPVVMGPQNTGISAEWPGAACADLSRVLGCSAIFAQGCCGDINPVRRGGQPVAEKVGRELAGSVLIGWERAEEVRAGGTAAARETVLLPQRKPTVEEAEVALREAKERLAAAEAEHRGADETTLRRRVVPARQLLGWACDYLAAARQDTAPPAEMDVQALRIGDVAIVATGAETFIEIGQEMQRRSPVPRTVALGYSNGCFGYLPTEKAFPLGGYEVDGAFKYYGTLMVTPECERRTLEAAERVLAQIAS